MSPLLFTHLAWADGQLLKAVQASPAVQNAPDVRNLLHHIVVVQRFFLMMLRSEPPALESLMKAPDSFAGLVEQFRSAHSGLLAFVQTEPDTLRRVEIPQLGGSRSVEEILTQVVLHSQGHRSQCALRVREISGSAPMTDFIVWVSTQPMPEYP